MRTFLMIASFALATLSLPQFASADHANGGEVVFQSDDTVIRETDLGDGSERYEWTIESGRSGHCGTLKEAKKAARKALKEARKANKGRR